MLTRNFYNHLRASLIGGKTTVVDTSGTTINVDLLSNTDYSYSTVPIRQWMNTFPTLWNNAGIFYGDNNIDPEVLDTCFLQSSMKTGLRTTSSFERVSDGTLQGIKATYTIVNDNAEDVNIGEIVLVARLRTSSSSYKNCVIDRTVFDTITIPPGGAGRIYYTIMMPDITPTA